MHHSLKSLNKLIITLFRRSMIFPSLNHRFLCPHLRNSSLLFSTTYLHYNLPCGYRLAMLSAAWHSTHHKVPILPCTRDTETVAAALTMAPASSLTSSPSMRSAGCLFRCSPRHWVQYPGHDYAWHSAPYEHTGRWSPRSCCSVPRW